jgi:hypothetical protein
MNPLHHSCHNLNLFVNISDLPAKCTAKQQEHSFHCSSLPLAGAVSPNSPHHHLVLLSLALFAATVVYHVPQMHHTPFAPRSLHWLFYTWHTRGSLFTWETPT